MGIFCYGLAMEWHSLDVDIPPEPSKGNLPERNQKGINLWYCKLIESSGEKEQRERGEAISPRQTVPGLKKVPTRRQLTSI